VYKVHIKEIYVAKRKKIADENTKLSDEINKIDAQSKALAARKQKLMETALGNNAKLDLLDELLSEARTIVKTVEENVPEEKDSKS